MTATQTIRDTLAGGPLPFRQLHLKIGGDDRKLYDLCCYLRGRSEIKIATDEDKTITLLKSGGGEARRAQRHEASREESREAPL